MLILPRVTLHMGGYIIKAPFEKTLRNATATFIPATSCMTLKPSGDNAYQIGNGIHVRAIIT